jgi:hypothetical protein
VIDELQEQLLALERELDSQEGTVVTWEEGLTTFAHVLGEASTEHDASSAHADVIRCDFSDQVRTSSTRSGRHNTLSRIVEECAALPCLQEIDLEVCEVILEEELEHGVHPPDGQDLSVELDRAYVSVDRFANDCATEAMRLRDRLYRLPTSWST